MTDRCKHSGRFVEDRGVKDGAHSWWCSDCERYHAVGEVVEDDA